MKRLLCLLPAVVLLSLAACSGLSGCSTMPLGDPGAIAATTLSDEKALFAAEAAIKGVSAVAFAVAQSGVLPHAPRLADADKLARDWHTHQDACGTKTTTKRLPVPNEQYETHITKER